jgi:hypothetical protein
VHGRAQVELRAFRHDAARQHARLEIERAIDRDRAVLDEVVARLQHAPDRHRKARVRQDRHREPEAERVRVQQRQRRLSAASRLTITDTIADDAVERGEVARIDTVPVPARADRRREVDATAHRAHAAQHVGHGGRPTVVDEVDDGWCRAS